MVKKRFSDVVLSEKEYAELKAKSDALDRLEKGKGVAVYNHAQGMWHAYNQKHEADGKTLLESINNLPEDK